MNVENSRDQSKGRWGGKSKRKKRRKKRWKRNEKRGKKEKMMEVKRVAEEWEIWDEEKKMAKSEEETKRLVPKRFYK